MYGTVSAGGAPACAMLAADGAPPADEDPPTDAERLQSLAYEVSMAEARARERLANGLHDTLGQILAVAQFRLAELEVAGSTDERQARIDELRALLVEASHETRRATFELHSPVLEQLGLEAAIQGLADRLRQQCRLQVVVNGTLRGLARASAEHAVVLRVVRELLLNVTKHSRARSVTIGLDYHHGLLCVGVDDDGIGCALRRPVRTPGPDGGYGLSSAEAQMRAIGGHLQLRSQLGAGTLATLMLPDGCGLRPNAGG